MAGTSVNISTTYAGEFAGKYISAALLSANTLENGGVSIMPNVKYREVLKTFLLDDIVADGSCDFLPTGDLTLAERYITPKELQVNVTLCKKQFREDWEAIKMGYSAFDVLPKTLTDYIIAYMANKVAEATEKNIWHGLSATAGKFQSINESLVLQGGYNNVGTGTVDASNVISVLGDLVDGIAPNIYGKDGVFLYVPQNVLQAYVRALGGFSAGVGAAGLNNQGTTWYNGNANALTFDGIPLFYAHGLSNNKIVLAQKDNLYFGTGLLSDHNEVKVLDMADIDGSQNVRFVMRYTAGTEVGFAEEVTTWGL